MAIIENQKVKYVILGFFSALFLWLILALITTITGSQTRPLKNVSIDELSWLVGQWKGDFGQGSFTETWNMLDENNLNGTGCYVENADTVFKEQLSLISLSGSCAYISISDGNAPTLFALVENQHNSWIFENNEHDFPNRIIYLLKTDSSLLVTIEGKTFGIPHTEEYHLLKIKEESLKETGSEEGQNRQ